jgi:hypothetical protein
MLDFFWVILTNTCPDSENFYLIVKYLSFPTARVHTNSRNEANNRKEGCIAIVSYKWAGWVLADNTCTDPMGLKIINSLDFFSGDYKIYSMNAYFSPTNGRTGPATHHTRITSYQHRQEIPHYVKRQTPNEYARSLTQKRLAKKILTGYFVVLTGNLNDSHGTYIYSVKVFMTAN